MEEKLDKLSADWHNIQGRRPSKINELKKKDDYSDTNDSIENATKTNFDLSDEDLRDCCIVNDNEKYPGNRRKRNTKTPLVLLKSWKRSKKRLPRIKSKRSSTTNNTVEKKCTLQNIKKWEKDNYDYCSDFTFSFKPNSKKKHEKIKKAPNTESISIVKNTNNTPTIENSILYKNNEIKQMEKNDHFLQCFSGDTSDETPHQKLNGDSNSNNSVDIVQNMPISERCEKNKIPVVEDGTHFNVQTEMNKEEKEERVHSILKRSPKINRKHRKDGTSVEYQNKRRWFLKSIPPDSHNESSTCMLSPESKKLKSNVMKDIFSIQENGSLLYKYTSDSNSCVSALTNMNDMVHTIQDVKCKKVAKSHLERLKKYDDIVQAYTCQTSPLKSPRPKTTISRSFSQPAVHERKLCSVRLKSRGGNLSQQRKTFPEQSKSTKTRTRVPPIIVVYKSKKS